MISRIVKKDGCFWIEIDGQPYEPVSYRSFRPQEQTVHSFSAHGFQLFSVFPSGILCSLNVPYSQFGEVWTGDRQYDWSVLKAQADLFNEQAPGSYWSLMLQLDTRDWFLREHPGCADSFQQLVQTAGYQAWRESAAAFVCDLLDWLDDQYPERIFGVYLMAGGTTEWYTRDRVAAIQANDIQLAAYRKWSGNPDAEIPSPEILHRTHDGVLRDPARDQDAVRYWRFYNEVVADAICWFAATVKEHTHQTRLVGAFYGYITGMDLPHVVLSNYNDLTRVLLDPNVDALFCPASYRFRKLESTSGLRVPLDSFSLHHKLYFHEIDNTTWRVNDNPFAQAIQVRMHARQSSLAETENYLKREAALVLAKGQGYWWFDMFGGWYDDSRLMETLRQIRLLTRQLWQKGMRQVSEVALFIDMESNYYIGTQSGYDMVEYQTEQLNRMGLPWDCYLTDDLLTGRIPHDRLKLYIFANLFKPGKRILAEVKRLRQSGKSVLFLHAPGYLQDEGFTLAGMTGLTGFQFVREEDCAMVTVAPGPWNLSGQAIAFGFKQACAPLFSVTDQDCDVIGRFQDNGRPAFVLRQQGSSFTAYCAVGRLPAAILRQLARRAGAFIYSETEDPLYLNDQMAGMYAHLSGTRRLRWPQHVQLREWFSGAVVATGPDGADIEFSARETRLFTVIGPDDGIMEKTQKEGDPDAP